MAGYTKLFSSILASTIWREDNETRIVWITLLAMADQDGIVEGSIPGLADLARVSIADCEHALGKLQQPDTYSRSKEHDGRRIAAIDGGWQIINHAKYRDKLSPEDRRERDRIRQQKHRARNGEVSRENVTECDKRDSHAMSQMSQKIRHTEAEADTDHKGSSLNGGRVESAPPAGYELLHSTNLEPQCPPDADASEAAQFVKLELQLANWKLVEQMRDVIAMRSRSGLTPAQAARQVVDAYRAYAAAEGKAGREAKPPRFFFEDERWLQWVPKSAQASAAKPSVSEVMRSQRGAGR